MSRIEEALKNALFSRSIIENQERGQWKETSPQPDRGDSGINVLIISRDLHISKLINNLQSLLHAEIITADDIIQGMKSLFEGQAAEIDEYEITFTALMLDHLCCYYGNTVSD